MVSFRLTVGLLLAAILRLAIAQTYTSCNPLNSTCPSDPALGTTFSTTFNESMTEFNPKYFNVSNGESLVSFGSSGAELTLTEEGQSITVETTFYIFFGRVEVIFQAASGQGIISTLNLLSDDLDEIDLEIMGSHTANVSNNYFGWGNQSQRNSEYPSTTSWSDGAMGGMHNYTIDWTKEAIQWYQDGALVRTAAYEAPGLWPQTPCFIKFGIWAGGASTEPAGTVAWAGGATDWSKSPFTMTLQSLTITDANTNVSRYTYGDTSGSWQSISMATGESAAFKNLHAESSTQKLEKQWSGLSTGAKVGIAAGIAGFFAVAILAFCVYCIKQRRAGKREKLLADQQWEAQHAELMEYRNRMQKGGFAVHYMGHGEKF